MKHEFFESEQGICETYIVISLKKTDFFFGSDIAYGEK